VVKKQKELEEANELAASYKAREKHRLVQEIVRGGCGISNPQDALMTTALFRLLAAELDHGRKGDLDKAWKYMKVAKNLIRYNPEGLPSWEWKPEPEED